MPVAPHLAACRETELYGPCSGALHFLDTGGSFPVIALTPSLLYFDGGDAAGSLLSRLTESTFDESKEGSPMIVETDKSTVMRLEHEYDPPLAADVDARSPLIHGGCSPSDYPQTGRPGRLRLRCPVFHRLCNSGNPGGARSSRRGSLFAGVPNRHCDRRAARYCDHLLRADDPRLPGRWWGLYRLPRQSGRSPGSNRRRSAAYRLHLDCGSLGVIRRGPDHVRCPGLYHFRVEFAVGLSCSSC